VTEDTPFTLAVTGTRGSATQSLSVSATAVPGIDDIQETALQIAAVFLKELHGTTVLGLPSDVSGLTGGTPVAGLLVVTHYAWFTDEYEIGLAWHIMVAPDDWSDIYFRPRGALRPTAAYRLSSWSTALAGGSYTVTPTTLPTEVMR
jgi:hypothetical protein